MADHSDQRKFLFWQNWLFYSSIIFAISGVVFAFSGNSIMFQSYNRLLAQAFWHNDQFPQISTNFRNFIYGPFGGTIACCYIMLAFIAKYPFREKKKWARNAIALAFGVWVVIDSFASWQFGIYTEIYVINAFSIAVKALPLIFTWKDF